MPSFISTLMYNIFHPTMGQNARCLSLTSGSPNGQTQLTHTRIPNSTIVGTVYGAPPVCSYLTQIHSFSRSLAFAFHWILLWTSPGCDTMDSSSPSSTAPPTTLSSSAVDVTTHRSCSRCNRSMSSLLFDKHTLCLSCRKVTCSMDLRCVECMAWSTVEMADYLLHHNSLVSKGRKKLSVTTASSSSPLVPSSVTPIVASPSPTPSLSSIADDEKIKSYVQSVLANMLSQQSSQASLSINPFFAALLEVPDISPPGFTGGRGSGSLKRGRFASPSGVVLPVSEEDVMLPPMCLCLVQ